MSESPQNNARFLTFSKPFIDGVKAIFKTMLSADVEAHSPALKKGDTTIGDLSAMMGITGKIAVDGEEEDFNGMLVFSWPKEVYLAISNAMLMEEYEDYCDENADAGNEFTNIVMGNAKRDLTQAGYQIKMSIPSSVSGTGHTIKYPEGTRVIQITLDSKYGQFFMELCYKDA